MTTTPTVTVTFTQTPTPTAPSTPTTTVTLTPTPTATPCIGDCNSDGQVTIDELLTLVNIALGNVQSSTCPDGVPNGSEVNIALIIQAVNNALTQCAA